MDDRSTPQAISSGSCTPSSATLVGDSEHKNGDQEDFMKDDDFLLWLAQQQQEQSSNPAEAGGGTAVIEDDHMDDDDFAAWLAQQHEQELNKPDVAVKSAGAQPHSLSDQEQCPPGIAQRQEQKSSLLSAKPENEDASEHDADSTDEDATSSQLSEPQRRVLHGEPSLSNRKASIRRRSPVIDPRNPPIRLPLVSVPHYTYNGIRLSPKLCVELRNGDFLKILYIVKDAFTSEVTLRGHIFRRTREINGVLDRKLNEVCWILHIDGDDPRELLIQGVETSPVAEVLRRRSLRLTNQDFPALSFREDAAKDSEETVTNERVLVCRYKYVCSYPNAKARLAYNWSEKGLHRLQANECDKRSDNQVKDDELRRAWRGHTNPGGAMENWLPGEKKFLWQEALLHRGVKTQTFVSGDPMKYGSAGSLLYRWNLSVDEDDDDDDHISIISSDHDDTALSNDSLGSKRGKNNFGPRELTAVSVRNLQHRFQRLRSRSPFSAFDPLGTKSREQSPSFTLSDPGDGGGLNTNPSKLSRSESPEVVETNASIQEYMSSRTQHKLHEGRLSSIDTSSLETRRKRPSARSFDESTIQPKRIHLSRGTAFDATPPLILVDSHVISKRLPSSSASSESAYALESTILEREWARIISQSTAISEAQQRRYSFGDCFCGAGGMSRGAINAGLRINWAFDFDLAACQSYVKNFFGTPVYRVWANEFAASSRNHCVDVCHLSPPCQFFSPLHTREGKDDEMNTASLFAIFNLLKMAKPRIVTLEQTAGLLRRHPLYFNAVINMFTSRGFSVRWKILNCADFGLPQRRLRLFVIASCPGESLPPFPKPTHSASPATTGLKPWTSINAAISSIPSNWPNHDVSKLKPRNEPPHSGEGIAVCVDTTGGATNHHPSGKRGFTDRELACLQSFPLGHKFGEKGVKRQIGNAVPPIVATAILEEVVQCLRRTDRLE